MSRLPAHDFLIPIASKSAELIDAPIPRGDRGRCAELQANEKEGGNTIARGLSVPLRGIVS
jgi:hypothetical protein